MNTSGLGPNIQALASPFSSATVVVAEDYVDTFPHPQGLITYLHRLCLQLDVDVVSLERPVTVKGSWKTIIKIDAFLKTLISTLHSAILKGAVPSEEDFSAAFTHFEEENNYNRSEYLEKHGQANQQKAQTSDNEQDPYKSDGSHCFEITKIDEDDLDPVTQDKWYFNANPRGKTIDKKNRSVSETGKVPPEPYVIVEADDGTVVNQSNISEIEKVLYQVYKKETIEKYQKKSSCNDRHGHHDQEDAVIKKEIVVNDASLEKQGLVEESADLDIDTEEETSNAQISNSGKIQNKHCNHKLVDSCHKKGERRVKRDSAGKCDPILSDGRRRSARQKKVRRRRISSDSDETSVKKRCKDEPLSKVKQSVVKATEEEKTKKTNSEKIVELRKRKHEKVTAARNNGVKKLKIAQITKNDNVKSVKKEREKKQRNHPGEKAVNYSQYECDQCSYVTSKKTQLGAHKRRVHLTKSFKCEECEKEFGFAKDLKRHMKCHTKAENCCDVCGKMYKEERKLLAHKRIHAEDYVKPEYPCKFCEKSFSTKYVLAYHIKSEHLGMRRSYICPTCGKSFSQRNSYLQHANVHLGIKPFTCEVCGKRFSYEKSLKEHKFMHSESKLFFCQVCPKSFRQASGLGIHMKVHKATKDYVCSMCGKGFSQKQALERHERIHAGEKPYECGLCHRSFADSSVLRRHMILIHKKDPKLWRQDTLFHKPRKTDFFISVIGENETHSDKDNTLELDTQKSQEQSPQQTNQHHLQPQVPNHLQQEAAQQQSHQDVQQVQQQPDYYLNHQQQHPQLSQSVQQVECPESQGIPAITVTSHPSSDSASLVKEESASLELREPPTVVVGGFSDSATPFSDVKPYVDYVQERTFEIVNSTIGANASSQLDTTAFSSPSLNIQSPPSLPMRSSLSAPTNCAQSVAEHQQQQQQLSLAPHLTSTLTSAPNTASFLPITYQQRSLNYDTSNIQPVELQPVQYSAMITQQYPQTIVVLQDNLGTITYHQPTVNVSFSDDGVSQLQHINQAPVSSLSSLSSPPLPCLTDLSQNITAVSSGFDTTMPSNHQQPHQ